MLKRARKIPGSKYYVLFMSRDLFQVEGFEELRKKIQQLGSDKDKKKEILVILRKRARPLIRAIRTETPESKKAHVISGRRSRKVIQPGNLKRSIGNITGKKGKAKINPTIYVGPRIRGRNDGFYGAWVHDGSKLPQGGRSKANPFQKRGFNKVESGLVKDTEKSMAKFIQKRINRLSL
jgi:hypothetical protein